jgi:hypothetical protein
MLLYCSYCFVCTVLLQHVCDCVLPKHWLCSEQGCKDLKIVLFMCIFTSTCLLVCSLLLSLFFFVFLFLLQMVIASFSCSKCVFPLFYFI